jgi:hypothetical protein
VGPKYSNGRNFVIYRRIVAIFTPKWPEWRGLLRGVVESINVRLEGGNPRWQTLFCVAYGESWSRPVSCAGYVCSNSVKLDRKKVMFSAFCRAILPLFMTSLWRIQNLASFGRSGVGNVSPVTIFKFSLILEQRNSVTLDRRKVMFSALCRAVLSLLMISLRRIQNL